MRLDPFYPIVEDANWCARLVPLGVKLIQLRVKDRTESETRSEIARARDICVAYGCQLIVNDYWQLAIEEGCDFVHLGQEDLAAADVPAIRRHGLRIGVSTHDDAELEKGLSLAPDYVALGPVYPTILKKMKWHEQGLDRVREWKRRVGDIPLVAIGGMSVARAAGVFEAGADIVSVVTDITLNTDPEARTREWLRATAARRAAN